MKNKGMGIKPIQLQEIIILKKIKKQDNNKNSCQVNSCIRSHRVHREGGSISFRKMKDSKGIFQLTKEQTFSHNFF